MCVVPYGIVEDPHPSSDDLHVNKQRRQLQILIVAVLQGDRPVACTQEEESTAVTPPFTHTHHLHHHHHVD